MTEPHGTEKAGRKRTTNDTGDHCEGRDAAENDEPPNKYRRIMRNNLRFKRPETSGKGARSAKHDAEGLMGGSSLSGGTEAMDIDGMACEDDVIRSQDVNSTDKNIEKGLFSEAGRKRRFLETLQRRMSEHRYRRQSNEFSHRNNDHDDDSRKEHKTKPTKRRCLVKFARQTDVTKETLEPDPRLVLWDPPVSPYGLLEEELYQDPWKLLTACMLLNKTSGKQVRSVIWNLFKLFPCPEAAVQADVAELETMLHPLGLYKKRAVAFRRFSLEYMKSDWRDPSELYGIGKYASDAYYIFCRGKWRPGEVEPDDKDLINYVTWLRSTDGFGTGLRRIPSQVET